MSEHLLKKLFMTLAKDGKADFIQDHPGQERGPGIEFGTGEKAWTQL